MATSGLVMIERDDIIDLVVKNAFSDCLVITDVK
jgi:hypothetical protein